MALMTEPFTRKAKEAQRKFFNKMQRMGMAIAAHDYYWLCSRGSGKSGMFGPCRVLPGL
mgnify:CR=1 FL=1